MKSHTKSVIYVRLLDEGVDFIRPTYGELINDNVYRLLPAEDYDPEDEIWEFPPGTVVLCQKVIDIKGKEVLVAIKRYEE